LSVAPLKLPFLSEDTARELAAARSEPDWLLDDRLAAARLALALPAESNQLFTPYHDLRSVRFADLAPYPVTGVAADAGDASLPDGAAALVHVEEDTLVTRALGPDARAAGVVIATFDEALRDHPALMRSLLTDAAPLPTDDAFAQVARAVHGLGLLVHVPDGAELRAPIVLRWSVGAPGRGLVARTVVSVGANARARILEEQTPSRSAPLASGAGATADAPQSLWWGTLELHLGEGATLEVASEQDLGPDAVAFVTRQARIGASADLAWATASVGARLHKSRIDNLLLGRGSSVRQAEIGFGGGSQLFDLTSYTRHLAEDTTGDLLSKGVFTGRSRGYIKGLIEIAKVARGTDSFLGEFSMLLDRTARSVTIPSLEIDQPDVRRAAHSSSVGPIDETQVFYLMSRGLSREQARKAIVMGFLEPVVARIPLPEAQDRLRGLLERKWPTRAEARSAA
jgi:Fe-S cluster assembly protein SufB